MFELYQLEQLLAVAEFGTLSVAAEHLHLSQPALSRSMKRLEEELQVPLFDRTKNKMSLNQNGKLAVEHAKKVLDDSKNMVAHLRAFERSRRTISIGSCAPAPLWEITPILSSMFPEMTISSAIIRHDQLLQGLRDNLYQMIVLTEPVNIPGFYCTAYGQEHLFFSLPPAHPLSGSEKLHLKDLDGETMLLISEIGFWHDICIQKMPNTHFLIQEEPFAFMELVKASALPFFTTDLSMKRGDNEFHRIIIPIEDPEVNVTYYCLCRMETKKNMEAFFRGIERIHETAL